MTASLDAERHLTVAVTARIAAFVALHSIVFFAIPAFSQADCLEPKERFAAAKLSPKEHKEFLVSAL